jgi:hydroxyethylthiazole kinase-like uncharacterized protein yjeF
VADAAVNHIGRLDLVPLDEIVVEQSVSEAWLMVPRSLWEFLPQRRHDFHKGDAGRVGIVAGSPGMIGAAELCARGALRGGAGLVTVFAHPAIYQVLATRLPAEVMVRKMDDSGAAIHDFPLDALAVGPGIGNRPADWLVPLLLEDTRPAVIDADALNALASQPEHLASLSRCAAPRLLTPHPGEMSRMLAASAANNDDRSGQQDRRSTAQEFSKRHKVALLLKGSRTLIAHPDEATAINSTGNPGMASGGMGDVLTGLCAAMLAITGDAFRSACLGAWLAGRSADLLIDSGARSVESLTATDVADGLGAAFEDLRGG